MPTIIGLYTGGIDLVMKKAIYRTSSDGHDYVKYEYVYTYDEAIEWLHDRLSLNQNEFTALLHDNTIRQLSKKFHVSYSILSAYVKALGINTKQLQSSRMERTLYNKQLVKKQSINNKVDNTIDAHKNEIISIYNTAISKQDLINKISKYNLTYNEAIAVLKKLGLKMPHASVFRHRRILHDIKVKYGDIIDNMVSMRIPVLDIIRRLELNTTEASNLNIYMREYYSDYHSDSHQSSVFEKIRTSSKNATINNHNHDYYVINSHKTEIINLIHNNVLSNRAIIKNIRKICNNNKLMHDSIINYLNDVIHISDSKVRTSIIDVLSHPINYSNQKLVDICKKHNVIVPDEFMNFRMAYYIYALINNDDMFREYVGFGIFESAKDISVSLGDEFQCRYAVYGLMNKLCLSDKLIVKQRISDLTPIELLSIRTGTEERVLSEKINDYISSNSINVNNGINVSDASRIAYENNIDYKYIKEYFTKSKIRIIRNESLYESEFSQVLDNIDYEYIRNDRNVLHGLEIDYMHVNMNIGIELNPTYTHNSDYGWNQSKELAKPHYYHYNKWEIANKNNIQLISVFENNIKNKYFHYLLRMIMNNEANNIGIHIMKVNNDDMNKLINNHDYIDIGCVYKNYDYVYSCINDDNDVIMLLYVCSDSKTIVNIRLFTNNCIHDGISMNNVFITIINNAVLNDYNIILNNDYGLNIMGCFHTLKIIKPKREYISISTGEIMNRKCEQDVVSLFRCGYSLCEFK